MPPMKLYFSALVCANLILLPGCEKSGDTGATASAALADARKASRTPTEHGRTAAKQRGKERHGKPCCRLRKSSCRLLENSSGCILFSARGAAICPLPSGAAPPLKFRLWSSCCPSNGRSTIRCKKRYLSARHGSRKWRVVAFPRQSREQLVRA